MTKATCPGGATGPCGKVVAALGPDGGPWVFANHRRPAGGNCSVGAGDRVRKRDLVHPCARCAELPEPPALPGGYEATEHLPADGQPEQYRPATPRPVTGGTLELCATHRRAHTADLKERAADAQRGRRFGVTKDDWLQLIAAQGGGCACGLTHSHSRIRLVAEHDHDREAECVRLGRHPAGKACKRCVRGAAGGRCNREIIGRFSSAQLRNLADYMDNPTAQRLGWWDDDDEQGN